MLWEGFLTLCRPFLPSYCRPMSVAGGYPAGVVGPSTSSSLGGGGFIRVNGNPMEQDVAAKHSGQCAQVKKQGRQRVMPETKSCHIDP